MPPHQNAARCPREAQSTKPCAEFLEKALVEVFAEADRSLRRQGYHRTVSHQGVFQAEKALVKRLMRTRKIIVAFLVEARPDLKWVVEGSWVRRQERHGVQNPWQHRLALRPNIG